MNSKISRYGNKRMLFGVLSACSIIFLLWYFCHPLSPYNERIRYVAAFDEIGPIGSGSNVKINGIPKGRILDLVKTDSCIYVEFEVVSGVRIPVDSKFLFASAGFLGNRELAIEIGKANKFIERGDTIRNTQFDKGMNSAKEDLEESLRQVSDLSDRIKAGLDSLENGSAGKQFRRLQGKTKHLAAKSESDIGAWKEGAAQLFGDLSQTADKAKDELASITSEMDAAKSSGDSLVSRLENLKTNVAELGDRTSAILGKLDKNDNSAALVLQKGGTLSKKLDQVQGDAEKLLRDIKANGLKMNVDIF